MKQLKVSMVRKTGFWALVCIAGLAVFTLPAFGQPQKQPRAGSVKVILLPEPDVNGSVSLEEAISRRRSVREFADKPLNFAQMGQLAWAGQGITDKQKGLRAAPSAWEAYPIELRFVTPEGMFTYRPQDHSMQQVSASDLRNQLAKAVGQDMVAQASCDIVIAGSIRKLTPKAGGKAMKFMQLEAGHVAENIQLQAAALGLASAPIGEYDPQNVDKACELRGGLDPLLIICVGYPAAGPKSRGEPNTTASIKKVLLIVPSVNFRDEELFETQRILTGAGIETIIASSKTGPIQGVLGGAAGSELTLDKVNVNDFNAVVFIGGSGASEFFANQTAFNIARQAAAKRKIIASISTASTILANAGVLRGVRVTGDISGYDQIQRNGGQYTGMAVERDGLVITGVDFSAVVSFAQAIVAAIKANEPQPPRTP
jgi:SagB-type dehydrogenase family enzyme